MWSLLAQKIRQVNAASGVEITLSEEGTPSYRFVTLKVKKGVVVKDKVGHTVAAPQELACPPSVPLALSLMGKGILIKKLSHEVAPQEALAAVLPQANPEEFYVRTQTFDGFSLVTVARKELVDGQVERLRAHGFTVLQVFLGIASLPPLLPFLAEQDATLPVHHYELTVSRGQLSDFKVREQPATEPTEYLIAGQYLQSLHLSAYGAAMELISGDLADSEGMAPAIATYREEYAYYRYFRTTALAALSVFFALLLVNFLCYSHYFNENKRSSEQQATTLQEREGYERLAAQVARKEKFLRDLGWEEAPRTSYFADRFASFLPEDLWLTTLQFYPNGATDWGTESYSFQKDTVLLSGTCTDAAQINTFISNLKTLPEIKGITMKNYAYKREEELGIFSLEILTQ